MIQQRSGGMGKRSLPVDNNFLTGKLRLPMPPHSRLMSALTRRQKIEAMLVDDPADTFLRYSLAMELETEGDHDASLDRLRTLAADQPPYVPAFFRAAQQLAGLGRINDARTWLREGIEHARQQGDQHAAGEMSELLASLGSLGE